MVIFILFKDHVHLMKAPQIYQKNILVWRSEFCFNKVNILAWHSETCFIKVVSELYVMSIERERERDERQTP